MPKTQYNVLSRDDVGQFYKLFAALLYFTDMRKRVQITDSKDYSRRAEMIWKDTSRIDAFIEAVDQKKFPVDLHLSQEDREILQSWKRFRSGDYFLVRHESTGSLFVDTSCNVYRVLGLQNALDQLIPRVPTPVRATLLPWKDKLITDGRLAYEQRSWPQELLRSLDTVCNEIIRMGTVITTL